MPKISAGSNPDLSTPTPTTPISIPHPATPTPTAPSPTLTTPATPNPIPPQATPKTEPAPPSPQAPEVIPPGAAPAPNAQAPEVIPPGAAPGPSPQEPEITPAPAAPTPSPQAPEVAAPPAAPETSPQAPEGSLGVTANELPDVMNGWSVKRTILNQPVYNEKDKRVGSVDDLIVTRDKALSEAIVNAGGFIGLRKHNVAIPVSQFKLVDKKLVLPGATNKALNASPEFRDVTEGWSIKRTILGQPVYNEIDERIGSVDDIIVTPDKALSYGIINAGGFLGLTKHNVAVPVSQFKQVNNKLVLPGATKKALKASPEFQYAR